MLGIRAEPTKPTEPALGLVWQGILKKIDVPGSESEWVSAADSMSEIVFASSDPTSSRRISRQVAAGELRTVLPRVYSSNLLDDPAKVVRRNLPLLLGTLFPNAVLSHRSALEGGALNGPDVYLTYRYTKKLRWKRGSSGTTKLGARRRLKRRSNWAESGESNGALQCL